LFDLSDIYGINDELDIKCCDEHMLTKWVKLHEIVRKVGISHE
jgi:hypothetical protein